jgi:DNA repair protein SbcC/Rad50
MLKSISSYNFQSHKSTIIDFCDGLNVITGSSDSGKSSVIRAFRWVYENRPSGDSIKNWDSKKEDEVSVGIQLSEGSVCKERINGKVKYLLDTEKGSYEFEAIRSDVPQEIIEFFNLSEYNIQTQHDPYFLLNDSPGEVAKKLNSLVGLDIIDTIFKNLNSKILGLKRIIEESEKTRTFLNEQLKE